jgi:ribose transport system substrate-binding protein
MEETKMIRRRKVAAALSAAAISALLLTGCATAADTNTDTTGDRPDWCGPTEITMGLTDGFGGNNWRLVTTASARDEIAKCSSVTELLYADGQGDTTKAISDINAMVAKGVKALVVFPDAGQAILPALRDAYNAGVVTVPYRVDPSGMDGSDFDIWIGGDFVTDGKNWGEWTKKNFPDGANILFLSGPAGNSQGVDERKGFESVLGDGTGAYKYIGEQPFEVTNWDAALTQKVLTAAIAKYKKIDVIMSDFGPVMVSSLGEFTKSGRSIPALATSDGNILGCFFEDNKAANKDFKLMTVATGNDHVRLAVQHAVARATGGVVPTATSFAGPVFEDSESSDMPVQCNRDIDPWTFLSAQLKGEDQQALLKK